MGIMETSNIWLTLTLLVAIVLQVSFGWSEIKEATEGGWTSWTEWSECSRSCDGGAAYQIRHCKDANNGACAGETIRYKTCNNQACPQSGQDFRSQQCQAYDDVPYRDQLYEWVPYHDVNNMCVLRCTARGRGFSVILAPKVLDGTRCNPNSRNMCINGKCRVVGCDDILESDKKLDDCGVCGGDGTTCNSRHPGLNGGKHVSVFSWERSDFGHCSISCGVGVQSTKVVCKESSTGNIVHNRYCAGSTKPEVETRTCTIRNCHAVWITAEWQPCPVSCGRGVARRAVYCVRESPGGGFVRIDDTLCTDARPVTETYCNEYPCPVWIAGDWAPCPVTCGRGRQHREAICRRTADLDCSLDHKPITSRTCDTGVVCDKDKETVGKKSDRGTLPDPSPTQGYRPTIHFIDQTAAPTGHTATEGPKVYFFHQADRVSFVPPSDPRHSEAQGFGQSKESQVLDTAGGQASQPGLWVGSGMGADRSASLESDVNEQKVSITPSYIASHWSTCSVTCGAGLRNRRVVCKVYLKFADVVQDLPDSECEGTKPAETEVCKGASCDHVSPLDQRHVFIWRFTGYGECSASCAGGLQAAQFVCVRIKDFAVVSRIQCQDIHLPDHKPQSCNMLPCPPEWQVTPVGSCSRRCGGGHRYQRVQCIQRHGKEHYDFHEVPIVNCSSQKKPLSEIECNIQPCPPTWSARPWSDCTRSCGNGTQYREVVCEQRLGPEESEVLPDDFCRDLKLPLKFQYCNLKKCPKRSKEYIIPDTSWLVQLTPVKKLYIDVGGRVTIIPKTSIKIKCPVRKISRKMIEWKHNGKVVPHSGRLRRSRKKGILLLRKSRPSDTGVYTCSAGNATDSIVLDFHTKEEANKKRQHRTSLLRLRYGDNITESSVAGEYRASLKMIEKEKHISTLPFHYVTEPWSVCSKSCGGAGLQRRLITCDLVFPQYYFIVPDKFCTNKGQEKPVDTRDCGYQKCPHWQHGEWSDCSDRYCVRANVASRKRNLICMTQNATLVPTSMCDPMTRPNDTLECSNNRCYATWETSDWSKCSKTCGGQGYRRRTLTCVWYASRTPAGANCRHMRRPPAVRECSSIEPCDTGRCRDRSKYCALVTRLNFCRYKQYHEECCLSCTKHKQLMEKHRRRRRRRKYDRML